jgi:ribonuclease-3 family protein
VLFSPDFSREQLNQMSPLVMAYVGDAVYELAVRSKIVGGPKKKIGELHQDTVNVVKADSQARVLRRIEERLDEEEIQVVKRGRNAKSHSYPRNVVVGDYRLSTGLEALIGYLYLKGDRERLQEIIGWITENLELGEGKT